MAGSMTPPIRSPLWPVKSGPSAFGINDVDSSDDDEEANPTLNDKTVSKPRTVPRSVSVSFLEFSSSICLNVEQDKLVMAYAFLFLSSLASHSHSHISRMSQQSI